jgi:hypothetical protein
MDAALVADAMGRPGEATGSSVKAVKLPKKEGGKVVTEVEDTRSWLKGRERASQSTYDTRLKGPQPKWSAKDNPPPYPDWAKEGN